MPAERTKNEFKKKSVPDLIQTKKDCVILKKKPDIIKHETMS